MNGLESKDVLAIIFSFLPMDEFINVFTVSKFWNDVSNEENLWKLIFDSRIKNETTTKALNLQKLLKLEIKMKEFCKNCMLKELIPKWKSQFCLEIDNKQINLKNLLILTQKLSGFRYLYKIIIEKNNIYDIMFQNYTLENKLIFQKLFLELYQRNGLKFKYFRDIYIKLFKLKNKEILTFIQPFLIKEFQNKIKNPVAIFQHAISYDTVSIEIIQSLLENRKKELILNQNLLTIAIKFASPTIVKYLILSGFDTKQQTIHPLISLLSTCYPDENCLEKLKFLLRYSLNVNVKDRNGDTPLTLVCQMKPLNNYVYKMIQILVNYGANLNERNKNEETAYSLIKKQVFENEDNIKIGLEIEGLFNKISVKK